jgi:hypothetical protein
MRINLIQVSIRRGGSYNDELTVQARLEGIKVFEHTVPLPLVDDMTTVFDQAFEIAKEATRSAILEAQRIEKKGEGEKP